MLQRFKHTRRARLHKTTVPTCSHLFIYIPNCSHMFPLPQRNRYQSLAKKSDITVLRQKKKRRRAYALLKPYISRTKALSKTYQHHAKKSSGNHPQRHPAHHGLLLQNSLPHPAPHPPVHRQAPRPDHHHRRLLQLHRPDPRKCTGFAKRMSKHHRQNFTGKKDRLQAYPPEAKSENIYSLFCKSDSETPVMAIKREEISTVLLGKHALNNTFIIYSNGTYVRLYDRSIYAMNQTEQGMVSAFCNQQPSLLRSFRQLPGQFIISVQQRNILSILQVFDQFKQLSDVFGVTIIFGVVAQLQDHHFF